MNPPTEAAPPPMDTRVPLELPEQIERFREFFEVHERYLQDLHEQVRKGQPWLNVEFADLARHSPELADMLLDQPEEILKAWQIAIEKMDMPAHEGVVPRIEIRIMNLPHQQHVDIRNVRAKHLGKLLEMTGIVRQKSPVRPQMTSAKFECPSCGAVLVVLQLDQKFKEPTKCSCGRKGKFKLLSKELVDAQSMTLEEASDDLDGGEQPKRLKLLLKNDLVAPLTDRRTNPGTRITVVGVVKDVPIVLQTGGQSTNFDLMVEVNYVEAVHEEFGEIAISPEEEVAIRELSQDPDLFEKFVASIAPSIYGHEPIKQALILQMFGGVHKSRDRGVKSRGDIHMLLIGDPGSGKCVTGDTLVQIADGTIASMQSIHEQHRGRAKSAIAYHPTSALRVPTIDEYGHMSMSDVPTLWCRNERTSLLKITLRSGDSITTTADHPFFTTKDAIVLPVAAKEVRVGTPIATPRQVLVKTEPQPFDHMWRKSNANNAVHINCPSTLTPDVSRVFGYLAGDGWVAKGYRGQMLCVTNNDAEVIRDVATVLRDAFGVRVTIRPPHQGKAAREVYACSSELVSFITTSAPELARLAGEKSVPAIVMRSPDGVVAAFLSGLFECDAHNNPRARSVEYATKSLQMAREVRILLLRFGIHSQLLYKRKCATNTFARQVRTYYEVHITGAEADHFNRIIGFVSKRKKSVSHTTCYNTNNDTLPCIGGLLRALRVSQGKKLTQMGIPAGSYRHYERGNRSPSREQVARILDVCADHPLTKQLQAFVEADIFWDAVERVEEVITPSSGVLVYDFEVSHVHNFVANGVVIHNSQMLKRVSSIAPKARFVSGKGASGAGLTAAVVKDDFLKGWTLEAGALVLANRGLCCTTKDAAFIKEDGAVMTFEELFSEATTDIIHPAFKVLALDERDLRIKPFPIKLAFRKKSESRVLRIRTRTGRTLDLTDDNEVLTCIDSSMQWRRVGALQQGSYLAVPKQLPITKREAENPAFAEVCGWIASDGSVQYSSRHATTSFYNANEDVVRSFTSTLDVLDVPYTIRAQPPGRVSVIDGNEVVTRKTVYQTYNTHKTFAQEIMAFGVPSGNKSSVHGLNWKIVSYQEEVIAAFLRGAFDGDGSVRQNPWEVTLTTGIERNARLFQLLLTRLGIVSSVKRSTRSWHCDVRGASSCKQFFAVVGTNHPAKKAVFEAIVSKEVKDRLDVLPNHKEHLRTLLEKNKGHIGAATYKYLWHHTRSGTPSMARLEMINSTLHDAVLEQQLRSDVLWDKIVSLEEISAEYVYDFTMLGTNNFVANNIIMHNCIDELDKMSKEDTSAMHEALEQQQISIAKANIQATLRCETTVLAAANPKFGRFDPYEMIGKQIDLPPALLNRFDLIFPVRDLPDKTKDEKLASFILSLHKEPGGQEGLIPPEMIKKYIAYARQRCVPKLTDGAVIELKDYYVKMRGGEEKADGPMRAIPISARQLEALVRLSEASAKMRLSEKVTKRDAQTAIELVHYCLQQIGMDPDTGKIDIDRITTGISASQRSHISVIKEIINQLEQTVGKAIPIEDVVREAGIKGIADDTAYDVIEKLKRGGDVYSPKHGFVSRL